jgi:hypothetical protein
MYVGIYNCRFFGTLGGHFLVHEVTSQPASQPASSLYCLFPSCEFTNPSFRLIPGVVRAPLTRRRDHLSLQLPFSNHH